MRKFWTDCNVMGRLQKYIDINEKKMIFNHCYSIIKEGRYPISDCGISVRVKNVGKAVAYTTVGMTIGF